MPPARTARDTRERLLDAAEELLSRSGYDEVSVRGICAHAQANPAAVHYHFGSKEQLVAALLESRLAPMWTDRLDRVRADPSVAGLVDATLAPLNRLLADPVGAMRLSLLARFALAHPQTRWQAPWFSLDEWTAVLCAAIPGLDAQTARRRCRLAFALLLPQLAPGSPLSPAAAGALRDFLIAGLTGTGEPAPRLAEIPTPTSPSPTFPSPGDSL
ncbi:putative TetR family transcriptional regulator [Gordonia hirsuta DSM 44140 = NBRC 16056]|uniref:Putative TetR family transcriptional regulator n=2 Tax=Gordonia hirsuta TaxID=53427 RepID=L7L8B5_9ACTN|nr:TetR/AcrR family transcriptional regulator [Gordonia hirsuta]GAC56961.1 putative TetR family transcriptional regulator [Gordonia hirsuta DSM 44140 = NBRC 16056]